MMRYCICGKFIWKNKSLCEDCVKKYGSDRTKWKQWLIDWVKSSQKELDYENNHRHYPIFEETDIPVSSCYSVAYSNLRKAKHNPNMEFEEFIWNNV